MFASLVSRLNNTRISLKVFLAPALVTAFMLGMAALSQYGIKHPAPGARADLGT